MNTLQKGAIGLAKAIFEYQKRGYTANIPLVDAQDYDLVIEKDGKFSSVQCKTTGVKTKSGDRYEVSLMSSRTNTKETRKIKRGSYDLLFVLCGNGDCYSIPAEILPSSAITVGGPKYSAFKLEGR